MSTDRLSAGGEFPKLSCNSERQRSKGSQH